MRVCTYMWCFAVSGQGYQHTSNGQITPPGGKRNEKKKGMKMITDSSLSSRETERERDRERGRLI